MNYKHMPVVKTASEQCINKTLHVPARKARHQAVYKNIKGSKLCIYKVGVSGVRYDIYLYMIHLKLLIVLKLFFVVAITFYLLAVFLSYENYK
jgi:hypothetical protein